MKAICQWKSEDRLGVMKQYGARGGGYSGNHRLYTPSFGSRAPRVDTLPNILWKVSGVTTRPASGLRLTVKNVNVPHAGLQEMRVVPEDSRSTLSQRTSARFSRPDPTNLPLRATAQSHLGRSTGPRLPSRQQQPTPTAPKATRTMLPPITTSPTSPLTDEPLQTSEHSSTSNQGVSSSLEESDSEDEIYSDDEEEDEVHNPPSRPGFESEAERSAQIFEVPFVPVSDPSATFPATLLQDHMQLDMEKFVQTIQPSGLSTRVNNVVRAFSIHGPLNQDLLSQAVNIVTNLHPVLRARFQRTNDRLYMQIPSGTISVTLESPVMGHERPDVLITNARRKLFSLCMSSDLVPSSCEGGGDGEEGEGKNMSLVSLPSNSDDCNGKDKACWKPYHLPSLAKKSVTFGRVTTLHPERPLDTTPSHLPALQTHNTIEEEHTILIRARLVRESVHDATLVLSFPRIICDYWSSCLFVQQLTEVYTQLEKSSVRRPSLAAKRMEAKRREVSGRHGRQERRPQSRYHGVVRNVGVAKQVEDVGSAYRPAVPAELNFQQVALREKNLLKYVPKEKLWAFWDSVLTATIHRQRGPNRVKVVPPVRIPSGLGEKILSVRPQTSRLRPLTGRSRPQTGRKVKGEKTTSRDSLTGPRTEFHLLKFDEEVCAAVRMAFPEEHQTSVKEEELLCLVSLGTYVLLLAKCCRGWGEEEGGGRGRGRDDVKPLTNCTSESGGARMVRDPLHQYKMNGPPRQHDSTPVVLPTAQGTSPSRSRRARMAGRLDLGSFLIGMEVSLRHSHRRASQGLFGPLSNDVGLRVNLSSSENFVDLVLALGKSLQSVRNHHHFPFTTVTDELGVPAGLPVRFSYLYRSDILQLSDPAHFYFPETAIGVKGPGLARFGSSCYLSPLCTKMDDSRHLELCLWEGYDSDHVSGVLLFQPQVLRRGLVEALAKELTKLMVTVAKDPCVSLAYLTSQICPPFSSTRARARRTAVGQP